MTKDEFDAIKERARVWRDRDQKASPVAAIFPVREGRILQLADKTPALEAAFHAECEGLLLGTTDRQTLLDFIEKGFDIDWLPK